MKICWDNLEKLRFNKRTGAWYTRSHTKYVEAPACKSCGLPFLRIDEKKRPFVGDYCDMGCFNANSQAIEDRTVKVKAANKLQEVRQKISRSLSATLKNTPRKPEKCSRWRGGLTVAGLASFDHYQPIFAGIEDVRRDPNNRSALQVKCVYCGKWFSPSSRQVDHRATYLNGRAGKGEGRFYCSDQCKQACPIWRQIKYPRGHAQGTSREVQPELRKLVFARDNYACQKCGAAEHLHCHHIDPVAMNPIESADMDNCITVCKYCHQQIHSRSGCKPSDLAKCLP